MSDSTPSNSSNPPATIQPLANTSPAAREIKLISHSTLFYWWPVWFFGFFMALWTVVEGHRLMVVPSDAKLAAVENQTGNYTLTTSKSPTKVMKHALDVNGVQAERSFPVRVTEHAWMGTMFVLVLLITIVITNVPLRGLWSFITIMGIIVISLLITLFHSWDTLFEHVANLRIYINLAGYLFISLAVFILWAVATFIFDRRQYIIFSPGQIRVCEHVGAAEQAYDTMGIQFEKQRDDLFRHYILGFGSGDLIVRIAGAKQTEIKMPNVLGIGWKLKPIQDLVKEKATVSQ